MTTNITNSKICTYGCNTQIYWNTTKKAYYEVETGNKHFCVSRSTKGNTTNQNTTQANRPTYYSGSGKPWNQQTKQQQHSNSIQVLKGSDIQKQYEKLSDIVVGELGGKIHGSQSHYVDNGELLIVVYYEVPTAENRELVKQRFNQI